MTSETKQVLRSYIEQENPYAAVVKNFQDDEFGPLLLMVLGMKIDALIELLKKNDSGE